MLGNFLHAVIQKPLTVLGKFTVIFTITKSFHYLFCIYEYLDANLEMLPSEYYFMSWWWFIVHCSEARFICAARKWKQTEKPVIVSDVSRGNFTYANQNENIRSQSHGINGASRTSEEFKSWPFLHLHVFWDHYAQHDQPHSPKTVTVQPTDNNMHPAKALKVKVLILPGP